MASAVAVQVLASAATSLLAAAPATGSRGPITIQNLGPNAIYVGGSGVTSATGLQVPAAGSIIVGAVYGSDALFARAVTADQVSPADTRVLVGR